MRYSCKNLSDYASETTSYASETISYASEATSHASEATSYATEATSYASEATSHATEVSGWPPSSSKVKLKIAALSVLQCQEGRNYILIVNRLLSIEVS